jgi:carbon storage regulator
MLVLTRKLMEKLYIGDNVCVTVVRLEGGQVRLGIEAPREIAVVRAELLEPRPSAIREHGAEPSPAVPMAIRTRPVEARGIGTRRRGPSQ